MLAVGASNLKKYDSFLLCGFPCLFCTLSGYGYFSRSTLNLIMLHSSRMLNIVMESPHGSTGRTGGLQWLPSNTASVGP